jgi:hypothetical protein
VTIEEQARNRVISTEYRGAESVRVAQALWATRSRNEAQAWAEANYPHARGVVERLKGEAAAVTTADAGITVPVGDLVDLAQGADAVARARPLMREEPFDLPVGTVTLGATAAWVGEGGATPTGKPTFGATRLTVARRKVIAVVVASTDYVRSTALVVQRGVQRLIGEAVTKAVSDDFLSPLNTGSVGVSPASITANASPQPSTGVAADVLASLADIADLSTAAVFLSPRALVALGNACPGAILAGKLHGVVQLIPTPSAGSYVIGADLSRILFAADDRVGLEASQNATIQMDTAPDDPTTAATVQISMWQNGYAALRVVRWVNWALLDDAVVNLVGGCTYA